MSLMLFLASAKIHIIVFLLSAYYWVNCWDMVISEAGIISPFGGADH